MRQYTRQIMGMPVSVAIADADITISSIEQIFDYFHSVDKRFSPYKSSSEVSQLNDGRLQLSRASGPMQTIFALAAQTKTASAGYFDSGSIGRYDPSGLVKGWAIFEASQLLRSQGGRNFAISAGGDIELAGKNHQGKKWRIGIRHPFERGKIVKTVALSNQGIATSGRYERGNHIYNPKSGRSASSELASLTVIGPNIYEADRFATAAFAMGKAGLNFITRQPGLEAYAITASGIGWSTAGFEDCVQ